MSNYSLSAKPRKLFGRKVKSLRRDGVIPGNVFGSRTKSVAIQIDQKELLKIIRAAGETNLIDLKVEGESKSRPVLVAGYAVDPVSSVILHADFHEVDLTVKTTATVPVKAIGTAPAVASGNVLVIMRNEIDVEALPADLPDVIEVDVNGLTEVGMSVHAKDLKVDRTKVTLDIEDEETIVTVQAPAKEEEPVVAAPVEGAEAVSGENQKGPEPAEGQKPEAKAEDKKPADKKPAAK